MFDWSTPIFTSSTDPSSTISWGWAGFALASFSPTALTPPHSMTPGDIPLPPGLAFRHLGSRDLSLIPSFRRTLGMLTREPCGGSPTKQLKFPWHDSADLHPTYLELQGTIKYDLYLTPTREVHTIVSLPAPYTSMAKHQHEEAQALCGWACKRPQSSAPWCVAKRDPGWHLFGRGSDSTDLHTGEALGVHVITPGRSVISPRGCLAGSSPACKGTPP